MVRYALASDLTLERKFGVSHLVITERRIGVCDAERPVRWVGLAGIKELEMDELFGSARLTATGSGGTEVLIYYTKALVPQFGVLYRVVNQELRGLAPVLPEEDE
ncbi:MAG: hypothetical protein ABIF71_15595 [Planctomycetota bacterium]